MKKLELTGQLVFDSLDDGGEALILSLSTGDVSDAGVWARVISNLGDEAYEFLSKGDTRPVGKEAHAELSAWIDKRVRITVEELP